MVVYDSVQIYRARLQRVMDYIHLNLGSELSLQRLASEAHFSPYHFHRIFTASTGETPNDYINRLRLERAANLLVKSQQPVTRIAIECGFSSSATFARAFRQHFGLPARQYRQYGLNNLPTPPRPPVAPGDVRATPLNGAVTVIRLPEQPVIYSANLDGYSVERIQAAWKHLMRWATPRGLVQPGTRKIGISFDDPNITPFEKCRYYACLSVPPGTPVEGEIGYYEIPGGSAAVGRFYCTPEQIQSAYEWFYGSWLPSSGYQPNDQPTYKEYLPAPQGHYLLDIYIPVEPLTD